MPNLTTEMQGAIDWLRANAAALVLVGLLLLLAYRGARPLIHGMLLRLVLAQKTAQGDPTDPGEVERRVATVEDLVNKLLRVAVLVGIVAVIFGLFDLWGILAGLGLLAAAIAFAGQSIILDYLMGILILLEGQYYKGDIVAVNLVEGTVEEVGVRRTLIRDARGTLHSISNGLIRSSSNFTRTYAMATVDLDGVADRDVEAVIRILDAVGTELAADPDIAALLQGTPGYVSTPRLSSSGATLRFAGRVQPEARARIETEMRRRVAAAMAAEGITLIRPAYQGPGTGA